MTRSLEAGSEGKVSFEQRQKRKLKKAELRNSIGDNVAMRSNRISTHTPLIRLAYTRLLHIFYTMSSGTANTSKSLHVVVGGSSNVRCYQSNES